ncbi:MAG: acetate--CoA ligase family protein [Polyangiaceae bacterium]
MCFRRRRRTRSWRWIGCGGFGSDRWGDRAVRGGPGGGREGDPRARARGDGATLDPLELSALLSAYGIGTLPIEVAESPEGAAEAAGRMGYPVVMKIAAEAVVHKSDVGRCCST